MFLFVCTPANVYTKLGQTGIEKFTPQACVRTASAVLTVQNVVAHGRPDTTHVYDLVHYWREVGGNFTTLPQYFKNHGYLTQGMGKIFHHGVASGNDDPISWSKPEDYFHGNESVFETRVSYDNWQSVGDSWKAIPDNQLTNSPLVDEQIANHAITVLNRLAGKYQQDNQPFFLAVGFHRPHLPFVFPASMLL